MYTSLRYSSLLIMTGTLLSLTAAYALAPTIAPPGEIEGGKFQLYFTNIIWPCAPDAVVTGFDATAGVSFGARSCTPIESLTNPVIRKYLKNNVGTPPFPGQLLAGFDTTTGDPLWSAGALTLPNDTWLTSTPDGKKRFYFTSNSTSYFWSPAGYIWRDSSDADIGVLEDGGSLTLKGKIKSLVNGGIYLEWGDDATLSDVNIANTLGVNGVQDRTIWRIQLGTNVNSAITGNGGNIGIGTDTPAYKLEVVGDTYTTGNVYINGGWFRSIGDTGWYSQSHGWGIYMSDNDWIRIWGSKNFYQDTGIMRTDGTLQVGGNGGTLSIGNGGNLAYRTNVLFANTSGNVGIGTATPNAKLDVIGGDALINGVSIGRGMWQLLQNTTFGYRALIANTSGSGNTALGYYSLTANTSGYNNTANGSTSMYNNTTGYNNTALGLQSLAGNTTGYFNTAIGLQSLTNNTVWFWNTTNGALALASNTSGDYNTALWGQAWVNNFISLTGNKNTFLGYGTDYTNGSISNATAVWAEVSLAQSNTVILGNNANIGIGTNTPSAKLDVNGQVRIQWWSPGFGKVLTSDATGLASWQNAPTLSEVDPEVWVNTMNYLSKWNGSALVTSTLFDNGNIGVGTSTPSAQLDVNGTLKIAKMAQQSLGPNGYIQIGELIVQWWSVTIGNIGWGSYAFTSNISFPIAFPNGVYQVITGKSGNATGIATGNRNTTRFGMQLYAEEWWSLSQWADASITWIAIGY